MTVADSVGFCQCGCGQPTAIVTKTASIRKIVKGQARKFISGHNRRIRPLPTMPPNLSRFCMCGCGKLAPIAKINNSRRGQVKNQPMKYRQRHGSTVHGRARSPIYHSWNSMITRCADSKNKLYGGRSRPSLIAMGWRYFFPLLKTWENVQQRKH
jgi:hypothetical protein